TQSPHHVAASTSTFISRTKLFSSSSCSGARRIRSYTDCQRLRSLSLPYLLRNSSYGKPWSNQFFQSICIATPPSRKAMFPVGSRSPCCAGHGRAAGAEGAEHPDGARASRGVWACVEKHMNFGARDGALP